MDSKIKITSKAQEILDDFMQEMNTIEIDSTFNLSRVKCMRDENEGKFSNDSFREAFLNNAKKRNSSAIVTKKGEWVNS